MARTPYPPISAQLLSAENQQLISLELEDGAVYQGYSFGAQKSIAGELVFQTGMVGYPESITDPSYRGQILVITFPLVGNYGVPSRETMDDILKDLPAHFESSEIHIAGLITASYSGEDFSHHLATSSLGTWLREKGVPAMYGVDTRALTKRIRQEGSMLGRMLQQKRHLSNGFVNGEKNDLVHSNNWRAEFEDIEWLNPNTKNLVADGESLLQGLNVNCSDIVQSIHQETQTLSSRPLTGYQASIRETSSCFMLRRGLKV
jgi:carbamoyl-phosphate synthase / aspartate carbamoyltransferase